MKYIVEVRIGKQWTRSSNTAITVSGPVNLISYGFSTVEEAEREATAQQKSFGAITMGLIYRVSVVLEQEKYPVTETSEEEKTVEESIVDEFLTLEGNGDALILEGSGERYTLASNEYFSKRSVREADTNIREVLVSMVYEGRERLRREIADAKKPIVDVAPRNSVTSCNAGQTVANCNAGQPLGNTRP